MTLTAVKVRMTFRRQEGSCSMALFYLLFVESPPAMMKGYVRVAPPLHPGSLFFACPKKSDEKKGHPGAAEYFLRFSGKSALA